MKKVYVYDNFSNIESTLIGYLYIDTIKGSETYSFEYDDNWIKNNTYRISIDPTLLLFNGRQYPSNNSIFGVFSDLSPDRWGRILMMKKERILAQKEGRKPKKLLDSDFLLGVYDKTRMGGIRLKLEPDGNFVSNDKETAIPPWTTLRTLEEASRQFENDEISFNEEWINQLLMPGSSLGGARPKATITDNDGQLWIAKFPSKNDDNNVGAWEKVASDLALMCELNVPTSKLETFSKLGSTFIVKRFDREKEKRIHIASAMTLLNKTDGASAVDGTSYIDIASFIKSNGCNPKFDLIELWKRIVFNMAISNTDDHLRNHAFILEKKGWKLSPLYDVNPVPYGNELALNVSTEDNTISFLLAIENAYQFGIEKNDAIKIVDSIKNIVKSNWEPLAKKYDISRAKIEAMRPAFSECYK